MADPVVRYGKVFRGSPVNILDLLTDIYGEAVTSADVSSFDVRVFDESSPDDPSLIRRLEDTTAPAGYVEDTLRLDLGWTQGGDGWNFHYVVPGSFTKNLRGMQSYRFEFKFNMASDGPLFLIYSVYIVPVLTDAPPPE